MELEQVDGDIESAAAERAEAEESVARSRAELAEMEAKLQKLEVLPLSSRGQIWGFKADIFFALDVHFGLPGQLCDRLDQPSEGAGRTRFVRQ
jgi:hypothetical protein